MKNKKEQKKKQQSFIGIDASKLTMDYPFINYEGFEEHHLFENNKKGFKKMETWLNSTKVFNYSDALFCIEHTGVYTRELVEYLLLRGANVWMESALHLKRSMGMTRGKNDKVDSYRIARYAMTNGDKAKLVQPGNKTLQLIKDLMSSRKRIKKSIQSLKVSIKELKRVDKVSGRELELINKPALTGLMKSKQAIEKRMQELINSDEELKRIFQLVTSVKCVGPVLAIELMVYTHSFTRMTGIKQLACYCGVAPFSHTSGTSVKGKTGTSNFANMGLKSTLHLAAISSTQYVPDIKQYYNRKVGEGKKKMSVINAIRNKLLSRVLTVVKRGTPYVENYLENNLVRS